MSDSVERARKWRESKWMKLRTSDTTTDDMLAAYAEEVQREDNWIRQKATKENGADMLAVSEAPATGEGVSIYREDLTMQRDSYKAALESAKAELTALQAHCDGLRHALTNLFALVNGECPSLLEDDHHYNMVNNALAATPSVSLAEHDRNAIKQFCEQIISKVRPYAQVTINGEHFVLEDWLRVQAGVTEQPDCLCIHAVPNFDGIHHDRRCKLYQEGGRP